MPIHSIAIGAVKEATQDVTPDLTAPHVGSGSMAVYATPSMAGLVENTCTTMVEASMEEGQTTVGVDLHIRHLAPTPVGHTVRIRAEVVDVDGSIITFKAQLWDEVELIGEADHKRAVIDVERFMQRVRTKDEKVK